jgi:release factor glutamine methyltransferase
MSFPVRRAYFEKQPFDVCEEVYEPAEDSFLFAENLEITRGAEVLDVGTGCGILGIVAAVKGADVIAVDLNPHAIQSAKKNASLNNVRNKITFLQASLLTAFNENALFDLVLFNAPYLPSAESEADSWIGLSWAGGANGRQVIDRFIAEAPSHLKINGRILLMQSTLANPEETIQKFKQQHLKARIKAERKLPFFEILTLIEAVP